MNARNSTLNLPACLALLLACTLLVGCGGLPPAQNPGTGYGWAGGTAAGRIDARAELLRVAARQIGTPYRYGGNSSQGFDCSGLVEYAHRRIGIRVPRTTAQQWRDGRRPQRRHLAPGDLVFFDTGPGKSRHVGIYEGRGVFIHAPSSGKRVGRASLDTPYWRERLIGARSFL